jgi:hypothetical protein
MPNLSITKSREGKHWATVKDLFCNFEVDAVFANICEALSLVPLEVKHDVYLQL